MKSKLISLALIIVVVFLVTPVFANSDLSGTANIIFPIKEDQYEINGCFNASLAAKYIDGCVLQPGETFSFNEAVGPRTEERGFVIGLDATHKPDLGSGICREATVLLHAAQNAGMEIVERHSHYPAVSYAVPGNDAAIWWGSEDFKFKNTLGYPILISTGMDSTTSSHNLWAVIVKQENNEPVPVSVINQPNQLIPGKLINDKTYVPIDKIANLYEIQYNTKVSKGIINIQVNGHNFSETTGDSWRVEKEIFVPIGKWTQLFGGRPEWIVNRVVLSLNGEQ